MGKHALTHTDDAAYLCSTCHTFMATCSDLKNIGIQSRFGNCFHFKKCYNILEHDSGRIRVLKYGSIQDIDDEPLDDMEAVECKKLFCKVCNNFMGWKLKIDKYVLIKKRII